MNAAASEARASDTIALPLARAWALLRDLEASERYVPGVRRSELVSAQREGVGAVRRIESRGRAPMLEKVEQWSDRAGFTVGLYEPDTGRAPAPFERATFRYAISAQGRQATRVELTLAYTPRGGRLGAALDKLVVRRAVQAQVDRVLAGMKAYYERRAAE